MLGNLNLSSLMGLRLGVILCILTKEPGYFLAIGDQSHNPQSKIQKVLCNFAGFDFGFEELEDIDGSLIVEATFGVV